MARPNVLFLVHGIGEHRGGWSQLPRQALITAAKNYDCFADADDPLADQFEIVEIRYDDIFDVILNRFQGLTEQFTRVDPGLVPDFLEKINDTLNRPDTRAATYAGDVLLYRLKLVSTTVLLRVMRRITETVAGIGRVHQGQPVRYGILGHSQGTTVVHDALQLLATEPVLATQAILEDLRQALPDLANDFVQQFGDNPFSDRNFQFHAVYMVSNTSRLLHTTDDGPYDSLVRPFNLQNDRALCRRFYNVDHCWDPISKVKRFRLDDAWNGNTDNGKQVEVEHVYQNNVHALDHYLMNPLVHGEIFRQMAPAFGRNKMVEAENRVTTGAFERWGPGFEPDALKRELQGKLEARVAEAIGDESIEKLSELLKSLKELG